MLLHFVFFIQSVCSDKITYQSISEWKSVSHFKHAWWWSSTVSMLDKEQNSRTHLQIVILENWPWNSSLWISVSKNSLIFQWMSCWPYATCTQLCIEFARENHSWQLSILRSSESKEQLRTIYTAPLVPLRIGTTLATTYAIKRCRAEWRPDQNAWYSPQSGAPSVTSEMLKSPNVPWSWKQWVIWVFMGHCKRAYTPEIISSWQE